MADDNILSELASLLEVWCERRELGTLAGVLPRYLSNNGLTDGWEGLAEALRHVSTYRQLTAQERETLKRLWVELDTILRNR